MYKLFMQYLLDNYSEAERSQLLDHYVQSGDYPESFIDYINEYNLLTETETEEV